jgi:formyltetrahydrofolate-dependent phosphoribosylglycinamide formyltransferase
MYKIAVFVSGRGSNLQAILDFVLETKSKIEIIAVVSDKVNCPAFEIAKTNSIKTYSVALKENDNFISYTTLLHELKVNSTDLVVLAGFLKKIPDILIDNFESKIINIHPALLPSFGGKGMYGENVHKAVFEKSAQISGATIHFVDKIYDNGKIIAQKSIDISDVISSSEIAERVLKIEHKLLPAVIEKFSQNKVVVKNNRVYILN